MKIELSAVERLFSDYAGFIELQDGKPFSSFRESKFVDDRENYKYTVYNEAREVLGFKWWRPEDIGTGKIQRAVSSAIQTRVNHNFQMVDNNLIDWRKKDNFSKRAVSKSLETLLFNFYKGKVKDSECFDSFMGEGLSYQFIAYLFFLKEIKRFLPISQERFDTVFEDLGIGNFKTSGNASWENYSTYLNLIKQTQDFLKFKDKETTLLDAHTFLWIVGQIKDEAVTEKTLKGSYEKYAGRKELAQPKSLRVAYLKKEDWIEIIEDKQLTTELDLSIFQALYAFEEHKAYASQIGLILGTTHQPLNLEIGRYAKRIATKYDINFTARSAEKYKYWDLFFNGWDEGSKFVWQLKPALAEALEVAQLTGEETYADELPQNSEAELYEGMKRAVTVNAYERNAKARELCVKHWKAICSVCEFNFEETYGEIGKRFIHVHHLIPVSQIGESYQVNPIKDLRPVCPNCHSMLHRKEPPFSIEAMRERLRR